MVGDGRPKKRAGDKLSKKVNVYVTPSEKVEIENFVKEEQMSEGKLGRKAVLEYVRRNSKK